MLALLEADVVTAVEGYYQALAAAEGEARAQKVRGLSWVLAPTVFLHERSGDDRYLIQAREGLLARVLSAETTFFEAHRFTFLPVGLSIALDRANWTKSSDCDRMRVGDNTCISRSD